MAELANKETLRISQGTMRVAPVELIGEHVRLVPLTQDHHAQLCEVALDEDLWRWTQVQVHSPEDLHTYINTALKEQAAGTSLPFATIDQASNRAIGCTRFANIERAHRRVEIGWTWIGRQWQRTAVNTGAKYLMLGHAFETLGCLRVELKTDSLNERSRKAMLRIGAKEEGMLRNHMITSTGRIRHTVYFSIIYSEWPEVKANLAAKLQRKAVADGVV